MTREEKLNKNFLKELEIAHKKYILLKIFIDQIAKELNIKSKPDVKLDL
jgi:hypothetical protein